jgi:WD40 repeat protein
VLPAAHTDAVYALASLTAASAGNGSAAGAGGGGAAAGFAGVMSGSADGSARLWCYATGDDGCQAGLLQPAGRLEGHTDFVLAVAALTPGARGRLVASASWDGTLRLWDLRGAGVISRPAHGGDHGEPRPPCVRVLRAHAGGVRSLQPLPCDRLLSGGADGWLRLWHAPSGACERLMPSTRPSVRPGPCLALQVIPPAPAAGAAAAAPLRCVHASEDGSLRVWALHLDDDDLAGSARAELLQVLPGHSKKVYALALRPRQAAGSGRGQALLASGSRDRSVRCWAL